MTPSAKLPMLIAVKGLLIGIQGAYTGTMQSESERDLLAVLWKEQEKLHMTDYKFAHHLGLPQSTISRLKSGKRGVSTDLLFKFSAAFPEVRIFLAGRLLNGTGSAAISTDNQAVA